MGPGSGRGCSCVIQHKRSTHPAWSAVYGCDGLRQDEMDCYTCHRACFGEERAKCRLGGELRCLLGNDPPRGQSPYGRPLSPEERESGYNRLREPLPYEACEQGVISKRTRRGETRAMRQRSSGEVNLSEKKIKTMGAEVIGTRIRSDAEDGWTSLVRGREELVKLMQGEMEESRVRDNDHN
ncbi:hypothetical protein BD413DRAFT_129097 [Trametes elegans]|nr:hypothetical protein BD413DRAFT_129097 [Trametes elegans]